MKWLINNAGFATGMSRVFTAAGRRMVLLLLVAKLNGEF